MQTASIVTIESGLDKVPMASAVDLDKFPEGDHVLSFSIRVSDMVLAGSSLKVSSAANLTKRLEALQKRLESWPAGPTTTDKATARSLVGLLTRLARKETPETNYPAARLLAEAEKLAESIAAAKPFYGKDRPGQFWLTLAGKSDAAVRVFVPEQARQGKPLPLVVALHGAGGSENLFFDGYGDGKIVRLCQKRGWLLVAPRSGLLGGGVNLPALIDELAVLYPVDSRRVFVIGHSMGAAQAVSAAQAAPGRFAAVAAVGGSGRVTKAEAVRALPFFVGVGDADFALRGARGLSDALRKGGVTDVRLKEYANVEHLAIVQEALPDVFTFFDEMAKR